MAYMDEWMKGGEKWTCWVRISKTTQGTWARWTNRQKEKGGMDEMDNGTKNDTMHGLSGRNYLKQGICMA